MRIPLFYALFAGIATVVNLGCQAALMRVYPGPFALSLAIIAGTGSGLVTKYLLDKTWIFGDPSTGLSTHARKLTQYAATGVFTTAIFWVMEFAGNALTPDGRFRYVGAVIGLAIGYVTKFWLDRRYVFVASGGAVR